MEEEEKKQWEEEVEDEEGVGVGGQDNELFAHTINLIIKKLKEINRRVIDHLISSRSVYSFVFGRAVGHGDTKRETLGEISCNLQRLISSHKCFHIDVA